MYSLESGLFWTCHVRDAKIVGLEIDVMSRANRRRGVNLRPRDKGISTLFPVVLRVGVSGMKLARRAAP